MLFTMLEKTVSFPIFIVGYNFKESPFLSDINLYPKQFR